MKTELQEKREEAAFLRGQVAAYREMEAAQKSINDRLEALLSTCLCDQCSGDNPICPVHFPL